MKIARLFKNGQSQVVCLPKGCRFEGNAVQIKKVGYGVMLLPITKSWDHLIHSIKMFPEDMTISKDSPNYQENDLF